RKAGRLKPSFVEAVNSLAQTLISLQRTPEAIEVLERARQNFPRNADVLINLSWAYLEQGQNERCLEAAQAALRLNPKMAAAHNNAGTALLRMRRWEDATAYLRDA